MIKHPRIFHLPFSDGVASDDKVLHDLSSFNDKEIAITLKLDGENTSLYKDDVHARSLTYPPHESRNLIKKLHSEIKNSIPDNWRICGENVTAVHSIKYSNLESFFYVHSIWNEHNVCLSLKDTLEWCELIGLRFVPILYVGIFNLPMIREFKIPMINGDEQEGYVVRTTNQISFNEFNKCVVKYVRKNHVNTPDHWMKLPVRYNGF